MSEAAVILEPEAPSSPGAPQPSVTPGAEAPAGAQSPEPLDWRRVLAGEDDKTLKDLERFADPGSFVKAFKDTQTALRNKTDGMIKLPGEKATDEERHEFAKALGIPESPDKYEIKVKPPEGLEIGEADKAFLSKAVAKLHASGGLAASPQVANLAHEIYYDFMQEQAAMMAASAVVKAKEAEATLRKEWGAEYETNLGLANEALRAYGGKDMTGLLDMQFADGTKLGAHPGIIRMLANAARNGVEDVNFLKSIVNAPGMGQSAIDDEMSQIRKWRTGTSDEQRRYAEASAPGGRLEQLMAMKQRVSGTQ